jgi:hypothetical protein
MIHLNGHLTSQNGEGTRWTLAIIGLVIIDLPISKLAAERSGLTMRSTTGRNGGRKTEDGTEASGCGKWAPGVSRGPPGAASEQNRSRARGSGVVNRLL